MSSNKVQPVILCGGSGTRLWPLSRAGFPKQFLHLFGKESLFQLAMERAAGITPVPPMIVGNEEHRFLILDQALEVGQDPAAILLEPVGRNTAPALTLAALAAQGEGDDPILVVTPADHMVSDIPAFVMTLEKAIEVAASGGIVTLGIASSQPETGYGYIRAAQGRVEAFIEKPDRETAERYLKEGGYYWNSGIFVLKASIWLAALQQFRSDILQTVLAAWKTRENDSVFIRPGKAEFEAVPGESIDYAVMEKCPGVFDIRMVPLDAGWNDVGSWDAAWKQADKDKDGNVCIGDTTIQKSQNVLVHASSRLVNVVGLNDVVVVETPDAVLVSDRKNSQDVRTMVTGLREEHVQHRKVYRPWGWYDNIDQGSRFKVKHIMVKPGASLSLQRHAKRAEHWVVVSGIAEITCGEKMLRLYENQSTYIPVGEIHRLSNPGTIPLEIIEVQSGDYLGEDDIERLDDPYSRGVKA